jgi:hypothetical protein
VREKILIDYSKLQSADGKKRLLKEGKIKLLQDFRKKYING